MLILEKTAQRNYIVEGLNHADQNDIILVSDVDEIPNLEKIDFKKFLKKLFFLNKICFIINLILNYQILFGQVQKPVKKKFI